MLYFEWCPQSAQTRQSLWVSRQNAGITGSSCHLCHAVQSWSLLRGCSPVPRCHSPAPYSFQPGDGAAAASIYKQDLLPTIVHAGKLLVAHHRHTNQPTNQPANSLTYCCMLETLLALKPRGKKGRGIWVTHRSTSGDRHQSSSDSRKWEERSTTQSHENLDCLRQTNTKLKWLDDSGGKYPETFAKWTK